MNEEEYKHKFGTPNSIHQEVYWSLDDNKNVVIDKESIIDEFMFKLDKILNEVNED